MILLDTNVLSELMRPIPDSRVVRWLDGQPEIEIWISVVTAAEIRFGLVLLPEGKRKNLLIDLAEKMLKEDFADQCLPFDCDAAREYAQIVGRRHREGRPISVEDAQIAAIAKAAGLTLATRNVKDFDGIEELEVVNPWTV